MIIVNDPNRKMTAKVPLAVIFLLGSLTIIMCFPSLIIMIGELQVQSRQSLVSWEVFLDSNTYSVRIVKIEYWVLVASLYDFLLVYREHYFYTSATWELYIK